MKNAKKIYQSHSREIDKILADNGYNPGYDSLMIAIREQGNTFLYYIYRNIFASYDFADDTNWWTKFKNVFQKASDVASTTSNVTTGLNAFINPGNNADNTQDDAPAVPPEKKWNPNIIYWGAGALAVITILIIVFIFIRKKS